MAKRILPIAIGGLLLALLLALAACARATPTPTPTPVPTPTPTPVQVAPTPTPTPSLRTPDQATPDNPLTKEEVEALLEKHRGESFTFVSWGGAYQAAQRKAFLEPFQEKFGITINEENPPTNAKVKAMVQSGNVTWDVVSLDGVQVAALGPDGFLEPLDFRVVDNRDFFDNAKTKWGAGGGITWSTVLAYNTDYYSQEGRRPPQSWADFWDPDFPGVRSYYIAEATAHLEFPLLAAGYSVKDITYPFTPEMEETVFSKLAELRQNVDLIFWSTGSEAPELLVNGEAAMSTAWNGRIFDAQKQGAPLAICWKCGYTTLTNVFSIVKGSPKKDLAMLFIAWTSFPDINARISKFITYGPISHKAADMLGTMVSQDVLRELPAAPENLPYSVFVDEQWTGRNYDRLYQRYLATLQGGG